MSSTSRPRVIAVLLLVLHGVHPFSAAAQAENQALQFSGDGYDYISIANVPSLGSMVHEFTWEARIKPNGDRAFQSILEWGTSRQSVGVHLYVHEGDGLFAHLVGSVLESNPGADPIIQVADVLTVGEWQDVVLVYDGSEARLYVDGELVLQESVSGIVKTATELVIGQRLFMDDMGFDGEIDEIRLWNRALEVEEFGMGLPSAQSSLVARYTFDEADATDWTGHGHDGELIGDAAMANGAFHLDGSSSSYIQLANAHGGGRLELESMRQRLTWEARVNTSDMRTYQAILEWGDPRENIGMHFYVNSGRDLFAHLVGATLNRAPSENPIIRAPNVLTLGKWHDVALTYDGAKSRLYVDGDLKAEEAMSGLLDTESQLLIGTRLPTPEFSFKGTLDEIRLWNRALTSNELSAALSGGEAGLVGHYTFDGGAAEDASGNEHHGEVIGAPEWIVIDESAADLMVEMPNGSSMEFMWIEPDGAGVTEGFYLSRYEVTYRHWNIYTTSEPYPYQPQLYDPSHPLAVNWVNSHSLIRQLNEAAGDSLFRLPTAAEWQHACESGLWGNEADQLDTYAWHPGNADGKIHPVGTRKPNKLGLYDMLGNVGEWVQDFEYNISNETYDITRSLGLEYPRHLAIPKTPLLETSRLITTWEAWIKTTSSEPYQAIIEWGDEYHVGAHLYVKNGTRIYANLVTDYGDHKLETEDIIAPGSFYHVALSYDGSEGILYVNGEEKARGPAAGELATGKYLMVGARMQDGLKYNFQGQIDEVRIWSTARDKTAIQERMNQHVIGDEGHLVAYYNFDGEDEGSNIRDHSGNAHHIEDIGGLVESDAPIHHIHIQRYLMGASINSTDISCSASSLMAENPLSYHLSGFHPVAPAGLGLRLLRIAD